jgi:hypothetical protein
LPGRSPEGPRSKLARPVAPGGAAIAEMLDRQAIICAIGEWGLFRDGGHWDRLRALYSPGAIMVTTWCRGDAEEFIRRSIVAAAKGARVQHFVGTSFVDLNADRAVAETRMSILVRTFLEGTEVDVTCVGRFHDWFERQNGKWRISRRVPIYEKDRIDAVDPSATVKLDRVALAQFAEGYRHLAYVQALAGETLTPGLATPGNDAEHALLAESAVWLAYQDGMNGEPRELLEEAGQ